MRRPILLSIAIVGFSSLIAQVIFLRQFTVIFYGNELTLGVILGNWLLWTAAGSGLATLFLKRISSPRRLFSTLQFLLAFILPATLFLLRANRLLLDRSLGEIVGPLPILWVSAITLFPYCLINGILFALGVHIHAADTDEKGQSVGWVYLAEAAGSALGGALLGFFLIRVQPPFQILFLTSCLNLLGALTLTGFFWQIKSAGRWLIFAVFLILFPALSLTIIPRLETLSQRILWQGYELLETNETIYGNIAVTRLGESRSFFENGLLMFTNPDLFYAEESVHFALLEHPQPRRVLLIGGGIGGGLKQVLAHPSIERVDYVELDPGLIELGREHLPPEETNALSDPRVALHHRDGRAFIKGTSQTYDVVLVNLPDPHTAQLNRFYTLTFFQLVKEKLNPGGILAFSLTSGENFIGKDLGYFLTCILNTLKQVFPDIVLIPGDTNYFIACKSKGVLTEDPMVLVQRIKERGLPTKFVREYYLPYRMSPERMNYLKTRLAESSSEEINQDFRPVGYFYDIVLWDTYFRTGFKNFFMLISKLSFGRIVPLLIGLFLLYLALSYFRRKKRGLVLPGIRLSVAVVGFSEIALEVIVILGFQIVYGYAYYLLTLIIAGYMVGLSGGSYLCTRKLAKMGRPLLTFKALQGAMVLLPLLIIGFLMFSSHQTGILSTISLGLFPGLAMLAGGLGGFQFPLANQLIQRENTTQREAGQTAGRLYALDLVGSCLGAFLVSAFLIPIIGISETCFLLAVLNIFPLILLWWGTKETPKG
ncbi:fused MFS/spermidine synthase [candidate division KSB1 bacterium]|nr:fused MFS/spermidine synthase [candidate division KSB1 bacterium]